MNHGMKLEILLRADQRRTGISDEKGAEYAGQAEAYKDEDADVLANFKRQSKRWGVSTIHVIGTYFGKHVDSIETFVREVTKPGLTWQEKVAIAEKGEGIVSRLDDARNYLDLFECLLYEERLHPEYLTPGGLRSLVTTGALTEALHRELQEAEAALLPEVSPNRVVGIAREGEEPTPYPSPTVRCPCGEVGRCDGLGGC